MKALYALTLTLVVTGCGMGTEVGNGLKPSSSGSSGAGAGSTSNGGASTTTQEGSTPTDAASAPATSTTNTGTSTSAAASPLDLNLLTAPCGSLFGTTLTSPMTLYLASSTSKTPTVKGTVLFTATRDVTSGLWTLADRNATVLRTVVKNPAPLASDLPSAVITTTVATAMMPTFTCQAAAAPLQVPPLVGAGLEVKDSATSGTVIWVTNTSGTTPKLELVTVTQIDLTQTPPVTTTTVLSTTPP